MEYFTNAATVRKKVNWQNIEGLSDHSKYQGMDDQTKIQKSNW